jgi:hypothetical protein
MAVREVGEAAVAAGWRKKAADTVAPSVGRSRLPIRERDARALLGLVLFGLSVKYVAGTISQARKRGS